MNGVRNPCRPGRAPGFHRGDSSGPPRMWWRKNRKTMTEPSSGFEPVGWRKRLMNLSDILIPLGVVLLWFLLQAVILPKAGVPT